jgi:DNA segregation ATPase FtsK/SpoIIIE-like protein
VYRELQRRKGLDDSSNEPRIVVVIDELAELGDKESLAMLSSILRIGRSFRVNVIAATQLPTKATCGEKNNYTVRFIGQVTDPQTAHIAAGRPETGAHLLPGRGAFLRVEGNKLDRLQAYHLDMTGTETLVASIRQRWPGRDGVVERRKPAKMGGDGPVTGGDSVTGDSLVTPPVTGVFVADWPTWSENKPVTSPVSPVMASPPAAVFPLRQTRELTAAEVAAVRQMKAGGLSQNAIIREVFGGDKNTMRADIIRRAINEGGAA